MYWYCMFFGQDYHFLAFQNMWRLKSPTLQWSSRCNQQKYVLHMNIFFLIYYTYVWKKAQKPSVGWCSDQQLHGFIVVHSAQDQSVGWIWSKVCRGRAHVERWGEPKMDFPKRGELKNSRVFEIRAAGGVVKDIFSRRFWHSHFVKDLTIFDTKTSESHKILLRKKGHDVDDRSW